MNILTKTSYHDVSFTRFIKLTVQSYPTKDFGMDVSILGRSLAWLIKTSVCFGLCRKLDQNMQVFCMVRIKLSISILCLPIRHRSTNCVHSACLNAFYIDPKEFRISSFTRICGFHISQLVLVLTIRRGCLKQACPTQLRLWLQL